MSYLTFHETGTSPSGKTKIWDVTNANGEVLGRVLWKASWRKYTFCSIAATFDASCLQEITTFLLNQMIRHKKEN
jgi:hypothetical protein